MNLSDFHFLRPYWFLALLPAAWILWRMFKARPGLQSWQTLCDPNLLSHLLVKGEGTQSFGYWWIGLVSWLLATLAMAGPTWSKLAMPVQSLENASVILLDLSKSMDATDIAPSRLERSKLKIRDFLSQRKEGQTALIAYAGQSHIVSPLTNDTKTIVALLPALSTAIMPVPGSNLADGLEQAGALLRQAGFANQGQILVVTDGVNLKRDVTKAEELRANGYRISVIGVGTEQGGPVPLAEEGGFLKDARGTILIPKLDATQLMQLANAGGGQYSNLRTDDLDIQSVRSDDLPLASSTSKIQSKVDQWEDRGPWLLAILVPLAALGFRKGWLSVVFLFALLPPPQANAMEWQDLWKRPDQRGQELYQQQQYKQAASTFKSPEHQGAALYHEGDFAKAADSFKQGYNYATSLAKAGKLEEALKAYDQILKQHPEDQDAKFNHDRIEEFLQQQSQEQKKDPSEDSKDSEDSQDSKDKSSKDQQSKDQNSDSQKSDENKQNKNDSSQNQKDADNQQQDQKNQKDSSSSDSAKSQKQKPDEPSTPEDKDKAETKPGEKPKDHPNDKSNDQTAADQQKGKETPKSEEPASAQLQDAASLEQQQATEQWLKKIPDDPAGLLRRKFQLEHQQRGDQAPQGDPW